MPRIFALAMTPLFIALLSGCSASTSAAPTTPEATGGATPTCPEGFFWNGTECEKKRTIILEQGKPEPPPPPPPPPQQ